MSISEQVKEQINILRRLSAECHNEWKEELEFALSEAADTIESISAKLQVENSNWRESILKGITEEMEEKKAIWISLEKPPYNDFEQELYLAGLKKAREIISQVTNTEG